jgi:hypothetical protein
LGDTPCQEDCAIFGLMRNYVTIFILQVKISFLLGDTPCQEDCAIFGLLGTLYWHCFGMRGETYLKSEYFKLR